MTCVRKANPPNRWSSLLFQIRLWLRLWLWPLLWSLWRLLSWLLF